MTANDTILGKVSKTIENVNLVEHGGLITSRAHELLTAQREIDRPVRWIGITEVWGWLVFFPLLNRSLKAWEMGTGDDWKLPRERREDGIFSCLPICFCAPPLRDNCRLKLAGAWWREGRVPRRRQWSAKAYTGTTFFFDLGGKNNNSISKYLSLYFFMVELGK